VIRYNAASTQGMLRNVSNASSMMAANYLSRGITASACYNSMADFGATGDDNPTVVVDTVTPDVVTPSQTTLGGKKKAVVSKTA